MDFPLKIWVLYCFFFRYRHFMDDLDRQNGSNFSQRYQIMVVNILKNWSRRYSHEYFYLYEMVVGFPDSETYTTTLQIFILFF